MDIKSFKKTKIDLSLLGLDMNGDFINEEEPERHYIEYFEGVYDYILNTENNKYWNKNITDAPDLLNFWFDFLDSSGELS